MGFGVTRYLITKNDFKYKGKMIRKLVSVDITFSLSSSIYSRFSDIA